MPRELTDEEVWGTKQAATAKAAPRELSDEEVFGKSAAAPARAPKTDQGLGFQAGIVVPLNKTAQRIDLGLRKLGVPMNELNRALGMPTADESVALDQKALAEAAAKGRVPGKLGQFGGNAALGLAAAPMGLLEGGMMTGAMLSDAPPEDVSGLLKDTAISGVTSKLGGEAMNKALGGLAAGGKALAKKAPKYDQIVKAAQTAKTAAYDRVKDMGIAYTPPAMKRLYGEVKTALNAAGGSPERHGDAFNTLSTIASKIRESKGVMTPDELENLRFIVNRDAAGSTDPATARLGAKMREAIDKFTDSASDLEMSILPGAKVTATPQQLKLAQAAARKANTTFRKVESVRDALSSANLKVQRTYAGSNFDNATRQALSPFIDPLSPKKIANLTPDEAAAIETVNRGAKTKAGALVHDTMRLLGRASPLSGGLTTGLNIGALGGSGFNPGVIATMVGTTASKLGADRWTGNNVAKLVELMAAGGTKEALLAERQLNSLAAKHPLVADLLKAFHQDAVEYAGAASSAATAHRRAPEPVGGR